jgi:hypothetical protein
MFAHPTVLNACGKSWKVIERRATDPLWQLLSIVLMMAKGSTSASSSCLSGLSALEAKLRLHKPSDERVNHAAHTICWYKIIQRHGNNVP